MNANSQVLARKWRPQKFADVIGQQHVLQALVNSLALGRLHHAYLFSGTRGVGKTTIARILAKGLNCVQGITATPCGECQHCREIEEGRFVDLLEIDAASRTKVEDTREILDNVQYLPVKGRFKVYLIDEVHMLSRHSFNALLKTLEEPPEYVKFLLATTDPQKLPVTVLSRCLQFHLQSLDTTQISVQLQKILQAEHIDIDSKSLHLLAQAADGSVRDALSLTDQAIVMGNGGINYPTVCQMLGTLDDEQPMALINALHHADGAALFAQIEIAQARGYHWENLLIATLSLFHRIAMLQMLPLSSHDEKEQTARLGRIAREMAPQDLQLYYQILLTGRKELAYAPTPRAGVEMTFLRALAFHPMAVSTSESPPPITLTNQAPTQTKQAVPKIMDSVDTHPSRQTAAIPIPTSTFNNPTVAALNKKDVSVLENNTDPSKMNTPTSSLSVEMSALLRARQELQQQRERITTRVSPKQSDSKGNSLPLPTHSEQIPARIAVSQGPIAEISKTENQDDYRWQARKKEIPTTNIGVTTKQLREMLSHEKTTELAQKLINESIERDSWAREIDQLNLPKVIEQLALNSYKEQQGNEIYLHVRSTHKHLNTANALRVLTQAFNQKLGQSVTVAIIEDDDPNKRTPNELRQQIYNEKCRQARASLEDDQHIKTLCHYFDAQLDEESIRPI